LGNLNILILIVKTKEKKMVKKKLWLGILAVVLVFGMLVMGCGNGSTSSNKNDPKTVTYKGIDLAGNRYSLTIPNNIRAARKSNHGGFNMGINSDGVEMTTSGTITDVQDDTLTLSTSDGSEFTVTINDDGISSIVGEIILANGTTFIVRTFDTIYLRASRWTADDGNFGESYNSWSSIKLKDIYTGNYTDLMSTSWGDYSIFKLSGTIDKKLDKILLDMQFAAADGRYIYLGGGGQDDFAVIGPGNFSVEVKVNSGYGLNMDTLPDGEIIVSLLHQISHSCFEDIDKMDKIPDEIPHGTIMATIRNLIIEPVKTSE
jgi:hypothetical protein